MGNNIQLYFLVEVYEHEEEAFYKVLMFFTFFECLLLYYFFFLSIVIYFYWLSLFFFFNPQLYCGYTNFSEGSSQRIYFLLSNKSIYFLKPGNSQQKFFKLGGLRYSSIDYITVSIISIFFFFVNLILFSDNCNVFVEINVNGD